MDTKSEAEQRKPVTYDEMHEWITETQAFLSEWHAGTMSDDDGYEVAKKLQAKMHMRPVPESYHSEENSTELDREYRRAWHCMTEILYSTRTRLGLDDEQRYAAYLERRDQKRKIDQPPLRIWPGSYDR